MNYLCKRSFLWFVAVLGVFVFNIPPTAKVILGRGHGLKSHPTDW